MASEPEGSTYTIDSTQHGRFDERQTVFMRQHWDRDASFFETE
ncbi:unnamed protein product, partial [marine sediment metagenome]